MFHMVVNTSDEGSMLLRLLASDPTMGRVTILPLDKLRVEKTEYPTKFGDDAKPLSSYLKCKKELRIALEHVSSDPVSTSHTQ